MIFFFGITNGRKELDFHQQMTCDLCGRMGQYRVFMTYMVLSVFFIPVFKWGKTYYVETSCCGSIYELRPETGRSIEYGDDVTIHKDDLYLRQKGSNVRDRKTSKICYNCGYETGEDFSFCPKCGRAFEN